ncbi:MAG: hypothetical protein MJ201_01405 [Mycoplasmoidaceae bacterium]|nr:hypothetical protein [Mycoplasmoidaceae bacterium]
MHDKYELIMDDFFKIVNKSYIFKDLYIRHKDHKHGVINKTFNLDKFEP